MRKVGHTLAEALIALTIVGVLAGIMAPMINKFKPDTNKIMFLKAYDSLIEINNAIMYNRNYYPVFDTAGVDGIDYTNYPLYNISEVNVDDSSYSTKTKYCEILAKAFGEDSPNCSETNAFMGNPSDNFAFVTKNGIEFRVYTTHSRTPGGEGYYVSEVIIDVNGAKGENCSDNCSKQDRFSLAVLADGSVHPIDKMSKFYIDTRQNYRMNKRQDLSSMPTLTFKFPLESL